MPIAPPAPRPPMKGPPPRLPVASPPPGSKPAPAFARLGEIEVAAPRIVINGVEGIGKTTLGAYAPDPLILMARGETGFATLRSANLAPDCMCAKIESWSELLSMLDGMIANCPVKTLVLDALGGFERLCHEHVCARDFGGDWGEKGFASYQKGYDVSVNDWLMLLQRLDKIREAHGVAVILIAHTKIRPFKNPEGPDFDRYACDCHEKTWAVTAKWADAVFFYNFRQVLEADKKTKRMKGVGDCRERMIYTQRHDSYDAKCRYKADSEFMIPDDPAQGWATIWEQISRKE